MLTKVVCDTRDWELRKLSFNKLDHTHLQQLAANGKDQAVRLAALVKLKQENWNIIFLPENITDYGLSTVLGAVALVDDPQPTSSSVVAASHSFIRQGDPSRIPELRDLLHRFGDVPLAEDYLNCGQVDLGTAGREWLSSHGYRVVSGPGSHRVRWGGR
jgi:hypothetical protein